MLRRPLLLLFTFMCIHLPALAVDQFEEYRNYIDNYPEYSTLQIDNAINGLKSVNSEDIEKDYLLGMLHFIQGFNRMRELALSSTNRPKPADLLKDITVQHHYHSAEEYYNAVENRTSGYKYLYCKYVELYRYSFNKEGLKRVTKLVGKSPENERLTSCKGILEDTAELMAQKGYADISKAIYEEAVVSWPQYPKYMLEALGDIERVHNNQGKASYWWKRCLDEALNSDRKNRCSDKIN